jgi:predicted kinase
MARFDQANLLDRVAERGALDAAAIDDLAETIAGFHERAEARPERGGYAGMRQVIEGNVEDLAGLAGAVLPGPAVEHLNSRTRAELERRRDLLEQRRRAGRVRHCHGDLHLGNIVLWDGRPVLFDCLEFDEALAAIDTFYDLAFTLMDLCRRELQPLAQRLLTGYLDASWDDAGTALLPLFLSCRATIRAKVQGLAAAREDDAEARARETQAARQYLELAARFLAPEPARLVAIGGVSGTGKSTLARRLAPALGPAPGAVLLRSDSTRKRLCGAAPTARLGAEAYAEQVSARVYASLAARAAAILAAGHAAIVDAVFLDPQERARIERVATERGVRFDGIWLAGDSEVLAQRVARRRGDASDATAAVVRRQLAIDPGAIGWHEVDGGGAPEQVAAAAAAALAL